MNQKNKQKPIFSRFPTFTKPQAIVRYLRKLMKLNLDGSVDEATLRAHCVCCKAILAALQNGDLENRLTELEQRFNDTQKSYRKN
jgi:hypothetical protein